jgi:uncharacterized protein YggE
MMHHRRFLVPALASLLWVSYPLFARAGEPEKRTDRTVSVSTVAEVKVAPDEVVLTLGIETQDKENLAAAKSANDRRTRAVLALADKYHLSADQVQLADMHMRPCNDPKCGVFTFDERPSAERTHKLAFDHYHVTRSIEVVLKDFDSIDRFTSDALAAGVTNFRDLRYRTTKNADHQVEARRRAVAYAKVKASHLAELNGLKLGKAVKIEEYVEMNQYTRGAGGQGMGGMGSFSSVDLKSSKPWVPIHMTADETNRREPSEPKREIPPARQPIAPGLIVIDATVSITFELLD